LLTPYLL